MLEIEHLSGGYGHGQVIHELSMRVEAGQTVAVLGPNGAGKSTLMAALSGVLPRRSGSIRLAGQELVAAPSHEIVSQGLVQVPEGRRVFAPLSVNDNLLLGSVCLQPRSAAALQERLDDVFALLPRLAERRSQLAGTLSGGEQQMVAVGRALMSSPRMLLLDEPFLGLAPRVVDEIRQALERLQAQGVTILLVEQKLDIALESASRAYVLIKGRVRLVEDSAVLARRQNLSQLYFELASQAG
jgi:branched-chain amino acid transport system ATP-binding protein